MSTNAGNPTPLITAAEFLKRADLRTVARYCSDTGVPVGINADGKTVNATILQADPNLAAALLDAEGLLESACLRSGMYTATDLAGLMGSAQGLLFRYLTRLTTCLLFERRIDREAEPPWYYEATMKELDEIAGGKRLFALQENMDAGVEGIDVDTPDIVDYERGTVASGLRRFFGVRRSQRWR